LDGWIIGLVVGGVLLLGLVVVLRVVVKAAATTAETAQAILVALEDVKSSTAPLTNLRQFDPEMLRPDVSAGTGTPGHATSSGNGARAGNSGAEAEEHREKEG
jgi:hypothetical protein